MPSLRKRHSWPTPRHRRASHAGEAVDSDPFAYFVSPTEDRVTYIEGSLTAGISTRRRSRSLPPFHSRKPWIQLSISASSRSPTARLKRWIERMEKQYFHVSCQHTDTPDPIIKVIEPRQKPTTARPDPIIIPISPPVRGRGDARSGSRQRRVGNNGRTPPRRPRVWREPSAEIWPVAEEDEGTVTDLGINVQTKS